jgi:hypothetical protein
MDQVAVITDVHANLPALQSALARIDELGIERVCCGGDLVGDGPHPNEVCALIAALDIRRSTAATTMRSRATSTTAAAPRRRGGRRHGYRPHPRAVGAQVRRRAVRQLRVGRQAQGRRPARRLRDPAGDRRRPEVEIERVVYDAEAVAAAVRDAGLPAEYADKLLAAA